MKRRTSGHHPWNCGGEEVYHGAVCTRRLCVNVCTTDGAGGPGRRGLSAASGPEASEAPASTCRIPCRPRSPEPMGKVERHGHIAITVRQLPRVDQSKRFGCGVVPCLQRLGEIGSHHLDAPALQRKTARRAAPHRTDRHVVCCHGREHGIARPQLYRTPRGRGAQRGSPQCRSGPDPDGRWPCSVGGRVCKRTARTSWGPVG